jgi:hypothetical protein
MSSVPRLTSDHQEYVEEPSEPNEIETMRAQISDLQDDVNTLKGILMRQYGAFKAVFGDQAIVSVDAADKWAAIKARMAPRLREAIDVLLLQGNMKRTQLAAALHLGYVNCTNNVVAPLKQQGWIVENGGNLSLKKL